MRNPFRFKRASVYYLGTCAKLWRVRTLKNDLVAADELAGLHLGAAAKRS